MKGNKLTIESLEATGLIQYEEMTTHQKGSMNAMILDMVGYILHDTRSFPDIASKLYQKRLENKTVACPPKMSSFYLIESKEGETDFAMLSRSIYHQVIAKLIPVPEHGSVIEYLKSVKPAEDLVKVFTSLRNGLFNTENLSDSQWPMTKITLATKLEEANNKALARNSSIAVAGGGAPSVGVGGGVAHAGFEALELLATLATTAKEKYAAQPPEVPLPSPLPKDYTTLAGDKKRGQKRGASELT